VETLLKQGCSANYERPGVLSSPADQRARLRLQSRSDRSRFAGTPLLEIAAQNNHVPTLSLLLSEGAKVDGRGVYGYTALMRAASRANVEAVSLLLRAGADPNLRDTVFGDTALHKATVPTGRRSPETEEMTERRRQTVRLLLQKGADKSIANSRGRKPLERFRLR
jgi:ankyrin repeat protein